MQYSTALDKLCRDYENITLLGDFNVEVEEKNIFELISVKKEVSGKKTQF